MTTEGELSTANQFTKNVSAAEQDCILQLKATASFQWRTA